MTRKILPYWQGELDSLCGVHAVINAVYALCPDMKDREAEQLFETLMKEVARKRSNPIRIIWRGMDGSLVRHLVRVAIGEVERKRSISIEMSRPIPRRPETVSQVFDSLQDHLVKGSVAIIMLGGKTSHWTVARKFTKHKLHLFDSGGQTSVRLDRCTIERSKRMYRVNAREIVVLRRTEQIRPPA